MGKQVTLNLSDSEIALKLDLSKPEHAKFIEDLKFKDESFVGTYNYLGFEYFWNRTYSDELRGATLLQRQEVHNTFLAKGLDLDGVSELHLRVIDSIIPRNISVSY